MLLLNTRTVGDTAGEFPNALLIIGMFVSLAGLVAWLSAFVPKRFNNIYRYETVRRNEHEVRVKSQRYGLLVIAVGSVLFVAGVLLELV